MIGKSIRLGLAGLFIAMMGLGCAQQRMGMDVKELRCEYTANPMAIDVRKPRLSWVMESEGRGQVQTAYQVLVASSVEKLNANEGDLWDSGKVESDQSIQVVYAGKPLQSQAQCFWKVRVWDKQGQASEYSAPARWEMGLLRPEEWTAKWVSVTGDGGDRPALAGASWIWAEKDAQKGAPAGERYFRRQVDVPATFKRARMQLTVDDQFVLYVNGKEVARSSGKTDAWRGPVLVDLTQHLKAGVNGLAVAAMNTGNAAGLIGRLEVELANGQTLAVVTDKQWKASGKKEEGWNSAGFSDSGWSEAAVAGSYGSGPWGDFAGTEPACRYLRKEFKLEKPVKSARLYASALGVYEISLNGQRVGDCVFAPGWTDYRKRIRYQTYDVTSLLKAENAIGVVLGEGWYAGYVGLGGRNRYGMLPLAMCQLMVEYADGSRETIATDGTWKGTLDGPILVSDMLMGETYDARKEMAGWSQVGFGDSAWRAAVARDVKTPLEAQVGPAVKKMMELKAKSVSEPKKGSFVFDLGQNMVGWAKLKVKGQAGQTVTLRFAEMLNPDGTIYTINYRSAKCTDQYTLKGGKEEVYEPAFTFRGFRYVEVTGYPGTPGADAISGVVVYSDTPAAGTFECSNPLVNQLQSNIIWGQRGNFLEVPTDCPQRDERLGWTGDAQVFIRTATYNMDVAGFFTKWLIDLDDAQSPAGAYPDVAPRVAAGDGTAAWGDAGVICPWTVYRVYGDTRVIEDHYAGMAKWIEYLTTHSKGLIRPAAGYGDWLSIEADTPKDVLATAYFAYSTRLLSKMAAVIGRDRDAQAYEDLFQKIKKAFNDAFVAADGRIKGDTQTCYVVALKFDLLPEEKREAAVKYLVDDIVNKKKGHLSTGFVGVGYLLPTLTRFGQIDTAYTLLNQDTFPSWLYSIRQGATTIWERWDGWTKEKGFQDPGMNSFNHYSLGSVGEWMFATVAGIDLDPAVPGYKKTVIRPMLGGGLTHAKGQYKSMYGTIASDWKVAGGKLVLEVMVPVNTTAMVHVPNPKKAAVIEGGVAAEKAEGVKAKGYEGGASVFEVGSGRYRFEVAM